MSVQPRELLAQPSTPDWKDIHLMPPQLSGYTNPALPTALNGRITQNTKSHFHWEKQLENCHMTSFVCYQCAKIEIQSCKNRHQFLLLHDIKNQLDIK